MLEEAKVCFFEDENKISIQVKTKDLDSETLEYIIEKKNEIKSEENTQIDFKIDNKMFYVYNCLYGNSDFFKKAFVYNIDVDDPSSGWTNQSICMISPKLGFIITPMNDKVARKLARLLFAALLINKYVAYLELVDFDKGIIELIIIFKT